MVVWYLSSSGDKCHQTSCRISCAVAKANQFVPVAVFFLNRICRAQIFVPVMVATCVKMP